MKLKFNSFMKYTIESYLSDVWLANDCSYCRYSKKINQYSVRCTRDKSGYQSNIFKYANNGTIGGCDEYKTLEEKRL